MSSSDICSLCVRGDRDPELVALRRLAAAPLAGPWRRRFGRGGLATLQARDRLDFAEWLIARGEAPAIGQG